MIIFKMLEMAQKSKSSLQIISVPQPSINQQVLSCLCLFFPLPEISFLFPNFGRHQKVLLGGRVASTRAMPGLQEAVLSHFRSMNSPSSFSMHLFLWGHFVQLVWWWFAQLTPHQTEILLWAWKMVCLSVTLWFCTQISKYFFNEIKLLEQNTA